MTPRARKVLRWTAGIVGALVLVIGGLVWWGLSSEGAAKLLIAKALAGGNGAVEIGAVHGRLRGPLYLTRVTTKAPTYAATIDSMVLEWTPTGLIRRQVKIDRLHIVGLHIVLPDSAPRDTAPKRPKLPMDLLLHDVLVQGLTVDVPGNMRIRNGTVRLDGRAEDYRIAAHATVTAPALKSAAPLDLTGRGNLEQMTLSRAAAGVLDGRVLVAGRVGWYPRVSWNLAAQAERVRPATMLADPSAWPGLVTAWARTEGQIDTIGPVGRAVVDSISGELRKQPLRGMLAVNFAGRRYEIPAADISWGSAHAVASGLVADSVDLRYDVNIGNLATAMPGARGALAMKGTAAGPRLTPRIVTTVDGRALAFGTNRLARLTGRADVNLAEGGQNVVDLRGERAAVGATVIDRITMALRGTQANRCVTATANAPQGTIHLALAGGLRNKAWAGRIGALDLQSTAAGHWLLERAAALSASAQAATLGNLCVRSERTGDARICAGGAWRPAGWRAQSTIEHFPLAMLDSILPPGRTAVGALEARLVANATRNAIDGHLVMQAAGAALQYQLATDTAPRRIAFDTALVDVRAGQDGVHGTLAVRASGDTAGIGTLDGTFALPTYNRLGLVLQRQPVTAHLDGEIPSLAFAQPFIRADSLGGAVRILFDVSGTVAAPKADGSLKLENFSVWLPRGRAGRGSVDVTLASAVRADRSVTADLRVVPRGVVYDYTLELMPQRVRLDSGGMQVAIGADGLHGTLALGFSDTTGKRLLSNTTRLDMPEYTRLGAPMATQPLTLRTGTTIPDLSFARIAAGGFDSLAGRLQLDGGVDGTVGAPKVTGTLRVTDLAARMVEGSLITGNVDGDLTAAVAADSAITADFRLAPRDMVIERMQNGIPRRMLLDSTALAIRIAQDGLRGTLGFHVADSGGVRLAAVDGTLALPQYNRLGDPMPVQPVTARLQGRIDDLAFAEAFSPQTDSLAGSVTMDVTVGGTMGEPRVVGGLRVRDGAAHVPKLGQLFHDIQLEASGDQSTAFTLDGRATAGAGQLRISGTYPVRQTNENPARIRIQGDRFEAVNTPELHAIVTPDITVVMTSTTMDVTGQVGLPLVHVALAEIPVMAVPPSDDVIFTDTLGANGAATPARTLSANVRIELGDSVSFKGFNFTASLGGALQTVTEPDRPTIASGAIVIKEGQYKAYGQNLTITNGRVRFAGGPVDNPALDIRAARTAEDSVIAGLQIRGTLKSPDVTIFSAPAMSQNRALEYIVLGHPRGENTGGPQGSLMAKAVSSAGLRGGNLVAKTLGKGIGLDEARLETKGDLQQASFVAGRYLSPNLYVTYGIGLFEPISTLRLRYLISRRWTLQAERGVAMGADVLFKAERGEAVNPKTAPTSAPPPTAPPTKDPVPPQKAPPTTAAAASAQ